MSHLPEPLQALRQIMTAMRAGGHIALRSGPLDSLRAERSLSRSLSLFLLGAFALGNVQDDTGHPGRAAVGAVFDPGAGEGPAWRIQGYDPVLRHEVDPGLHRLIQETRTVPPRRMLSA